ncbi:MAG TPA: hypothetical protein VIG08_11250 [Gemmatimonadales bacterium]
MYGIELKRRLRMLAGGCGLLLAAACSGNTSLTGPGDTGANVRPDFATRSCKMPRIIGGPVQMKQFGATVLPGACAARAGDVPLHR